MKYLLLLCLCVFSLNTSADNAWPEWNSFKSTYINADGRVIDGSNNQSITTSEGQAYALFFALVANDKPTFSKLLKWTENNLAKGDLTSNLPAWSWGLNDKNQTFQVLDANSASDADLWIAYTLVQAGRVWNNYKYKSLAFLISNQILKNEAVQIPNFGWMILPGAKGFILNNHFWRLNPSYLPIQIFKQFSVLYPSSPWQEITVNSVKFLIQSSPLGIAPEWSYVYYSNGVILDQNEANIGGYNAIRVYLWLGMLNDLDTDKKALIAHYSPFSDIITQDKDVYEYYDLLAKKQGGNKPKGFSAAVLPFLASSNNAGLAREFASTKSFVTNSTKPDQYYDSVLTLFGKGWFDGRYEFDKDGQLTIKP